jgi:hypothetical protein
MNGERLSKRIRGWKGRDGKGAVRRRLKGLAGKEDWGFELTDTEKGEVAKLYARESLDVGVEGISEGDGLLERIRIWR